MSLIDPLDPSPNRHLAALGLLALTAALVTGGCLPEVETEEAEPFELYAETNGDPIDLEDAGNRPDIGEPDADGGIVPPDTADAGPNDIDPDQPAPCLRVIPKTIDFGSRVPGRTISKTITLEHCQPTGRRLRIDSIAIANPGIFALDESTLPGELARGGSAYIEAGQRTQFKVTFSPTESRKYTGELNVESNAPANRRRSVPLSGRGADNTCPKAVATASVKGKNVSGTNIDAEPLDTVQFSPSGTQDPDGRIERYQWSIIERPQDSTAQLTPSNEVESPEMFLDLSGTYRVELIAYDNDGAESCGQRAVVTIEVFSQTDVSIQLVWGTPSDPDQTDRTGTDLDLHYYNTKGSSWNQAPWDLFWDNKSPDWGNRGDSSDDPSLDIDDDNGAGPENVTHDNPAKNQMYHIGVYYYDDNGFGESFATVRIYSRGSLIKEFKNKRLKETFWFWHVAKFEGRPDIIHTIDQVHKNGFPSAP